MAKKPSKKKVIRVRLPEITEDTVEPIVEQRERETVEMWDWKREEYITQSEYDRRFPKKGSVK